MNYNWSFHFIAVRPFSPFRPTSPLRRGGAMNRIYRATVLGFALATSGFVAANASVPLPVIQQASGMPTLAPMLKKITPAVVSIAVKAHAEAPQRKGRDARHVEPAADRQVRAAGSGVVI